MGSDRAIRVFLVEDHFLMREGLKVTLAGFARVQVVGEAASAEEAIEKLVDLEVDLVLVDLGLPGLDGIELIQRIKRAFPTVAAVALTVQDDQKRVLGALSAGADGYCLKNIDEGRLHEAILSVARGQAWLDPAIAGKVLTTLRGAKPAETPGAPNLSEREMQILSFIVEGLSNEQIAARLHLAVSTVKGHVNSLLRKLEVHDRVQAAVLALKQGYV
jgi:DNA-binding NarL/FixJ family response regulator